MTANATSRTKPVVRETSRCPICLTRPVGRDKRVKTCGDPTCGYEYRSRNHRKRTPATPAAPVIAAPEKPSEPIGNAPDPLPPPFPEAETAASMWASPLAAPSPTTGRYRRVLLWPDTHLPFQDDRAVALAFKVLDHVRPDLLILLGDIIDCAGFSRFAHNTIDARTHFQTELDHWEALATLLRTKTPGAERFYLKGNHEQRIEKWLYGHPHLASFRGLNLGSSLSLSNLGFDPQAHEEISLASGALTVTHGTRLGGSFAGLAARMEMATYGTSGVSGHTHRLCKYLQRDKAGLRVWIEAGHLALNPPHYAPKTQNWQQGVVIGEVSDSGNDFELEPVPFRLSYRCRIGNIELAA